MKVSVVVNRSRQERGNDASKRKHSPMSTSPRGAKGNSSHEEEHHSREESRDARMILRKEKEEGDEDEDSEEQEENVEIDSDGYDITLRTTDKKAQGSYNVNISRKRKDRTCRDEEKRVNSLIADEERTDIMAFAYFGYLIVLILRCVVKLEEQNNMKISNEKTKKFFCLQGNRQAGFFVICFGLVFFVFEIIYRFINKMPSRTFLKRENMTTRSEGDETIIQQIYFNVTRKRWINNFKVLFNFPKTKKNLCIEKNWSDSHNLIILDNDLKQL
ncbi:hypothetical protein RFI_28656 [Reticulomyxa filosa]|uniref:Uncharacterized protein n=1 Tax=Reticulomyxa filosa TaxID=46433 RepID=X6M520_RETFI|nr:hypothetical protein RFI_28656 [Reticulomyxa filosa]|eukprot:ETO08731.1 hypothetical protein RFI_28656 [Reticulomyxa filosa]